MLGQFYSYSVISVIISVLISIFIRNQKIRMNWNCGQKISPIIVGFKYRHGGTIGFQRPDDFLESRVAAFCQV